MSKEKENTDKQAEEIVGLDDGDLKEEELNVKAKNSSDGADGEGDEGSSKKGLLDKLMNNYKKFIMPAAIAIGASVISIVGTKFIGGSSPDSSDGISVEQAAHSEEVDNSDEIVNSDNSESSESNDLIIIDSTALAAGDSLDHKQNDNETKEMMSAITIDTAALMAELAFLDYTPEMEAEEKKLEEIASSTLHDTAKTGSTDLVGMTPQDSVDTLNWLDKEMAKLDKSKAENAQKVKELKTLEYKIDKALIKIEQAESARIINLARLYDGMRAKQVGKLFENLDDKAVLAILPRMKSANAAKILEIMPPKRAARISTKMISLLE
ncbi:MAG: hypothetical protein GY855_01415 [candidate division Zixibacteria bacterium]|nr:hypothetical protein [candidate division Zixibacteria bacterium]